jgi:hypothetical protein
MMVTLAGAMSTAELGLSLAEMIRRDKVHAITCTGANLEEDVFNLVAHDHYVRIPHYRDLTPADEEALLARHLNRVTDTCIPRRRRSAASSGGARGLAGGRRGRGALFPARVHVPAAVERQAGRALPDRPEGQLARGGRREEPADHRARLGGLDARQHLRQPLHHRRDQERAHGAQRHRVHDAARRLVPGGRGRPLGRLLPDRRRHRRRLPDLRGADARAGPAHDRTSRAGATSARSATRPPATAPTRAPCRTRRSPGASCRPTRRSSSSSRTPPSWRR